MFYYLLCYVVISFLHTFKLQTPTNTPFDFIIISHVYGGQLSLILRQNQASFSSFNDLLTHELIYMTENHAS